MSSRWLTVLASAAGALVAIGLLGLILLFPLGSDPRGAGSPPASAPFNEPTTKQRPSDPDAGESEEPSAAPSPEPTIGLEVGQLAPDFELPRIDGGTLRLSDLRGHPVWINFWAPWCPACRTEMPRIEGIWLEHEDEGLVILGVGVRDSEETFRSYASEVGATYPLVMDVEGKVSQRYRAIALPVHYWLDRDGVIRDWAFGELPPDVLSTSVDRILTSGQPIP